jgi:hypothetical protein
MQVSSWGTGRRLIAVAAAALAAAVTVAVVPSAGQAPPRSPFPGTLDEHPSIQYETRPPADRVARLAASLAGGARRLEPDARTGFLAPVLAALDIPIESQLLVFSKTGLQRQFTGPGNPRALYFNDAVVVGYIPGAPSLEIASLDPAQGVMFYTLEQPPAAGAAAFVRRTSCLTCHLSVSTLEVPGFIDRSNTVATDGHVIPQLGTVIVNHTTPHTERWGGWFVTGNATAPPYGPLGHRVNLTVAPDASGEAAIMSNHVLIEWLNRPREGDRYPASDSDLAALMTFDHQMHGSNLITRLHWEARVAASELRSLADDVSLQARVAELADYLLFVGEASLAFEVVPRPGFAEALAARTPKDTRGRSLADMDLARRLFKYPCSYLVYSEAFRALPADLRNAIYRRIFGVLQGGAAEARYAHLSPGERQTVAEILRDTLTDLPTDLARGPRSVH